MTKAKLRIEGMHCAACAFSIDDRLEEIEGVDSASTSFRRGQTKVKFDESKVDLEAVREAIAEVGYQAEPD